MSRTAVSAESVYVDPSALLKLYLHEPESRAMTAWRARMRGPLTVTLFGRLELVNGIALALARRVVPQSAHDAALAALDDDLAQGRLAQTDLSWRAAQRSAEELSRRHTRALACRSLDILHVASAITLRCRHFVTFDSRQLKLAKATGLKTPVIR